jgi:hypothetical protein
LASADEVGRPSGSGRSASSPEQTTILQRYNEKIGARLLAEDRSDLDQIREEYQAEGRRFNEAKKDMAICRASSSIWARIGHGTRLINSAQSRFAAYEIVPDKASRTSRSDDHQIRMASLVVILNLGTLKAGLTRTDALERVTRIELA